MVDQLLLCRNLTLISPGVKIQVSDGPHSIVRASLIGNQSIRRWCRYTVNSLITSELCNLVKAKKAVTAEGKKNKLIWGRGTRLNHTGYFIFIDFWIYSNSSEFNPGNTNPADKNTKLCSRRRFGKVSRTVQELGVISTNCYWVIFQ